MNKSSDSPKTDPDVPQDDVDGKEVGPDSREMTAISPELQLSDGVATPADSTKTDQMAVLQKNTNLESDATILSNAPPLPVGSSIFLKEGSRIISDSAEAPEEYRTNGTLPIGMTLGHFSITNYIGGGGMGRVYQGLDLALDRKVAIKVLPPQRARDEVSVARFLNEAKSAARLNHEHIAQVYFCGEEKGIPFIAFEYVEGINVRDFVMSNGVLPLPQAINFILQIADALAHAAVHGVTHRDVKPSNILITPQGQAKLIDMGLARLFKTSDPEDDLTASGVTLGTFDYISPEQARDPRDADVRSDIYSLGCTFFFMLTGQPPFPEGTVLQKLLKHQGDLPPDVRSFSPGTPVEVAALIQKMMAKNPKDRFQNPEQLMEVLIDIAELVGLRPPGPGQTAWQLPETRRELGLWRHLPWIASLTLLLICVFFIHSIGGRPRSNIMPTLPGITQSREGVVTSLPVVGSGVEEERKKEAETFLPGAMLLTPQVRILDSALLNELYSVGAKGMDPPLREREVAEGTEPFVLLAPQRVAGGFDILPASSKSAAREIGLVPSGSEPGKSALFLEIQQEGDSLSWAGMTPLRPETIVPTASPPVAETPNAAGLLIVDGRGERLGTYADVASALASVASQESPTGNVSTNDIQVELRYNGSQQMPTVTLPNKEITFYGAAGYEPSLSYQPMEATSASARERMFVLNGTTLTLRDVSLELVVPVQDVVATEWSMFEFLRASHLTLVNSRLRICNTVSETDFSPLHQNVSFIRESGPGTADPGSGFGTEYGNQPLPNIRTGSTVTATGSVICGEATLFRTAIQVAAKLSFTDCGINTTGSLFRYDQNGPIVQETAATDLVFDHALILCRDALVRHEQKETHRTLFPLTVSLLGSVVKLNNTPLMTAVTSSPAPDAVNISTWNIKESILLNVTGFLRLRNRQHPDEFTDQPFSTPVPERDLSKLAPAEDVRIAEIPPHQFSQNDFYRALCLSLEPLLSDPVEKQTLISVKSRFLGP